MKNQVHYRAIAPSSTTQHRPNVVTPGVITSFENALSAILRESSPALEKAPISTATRCDRKSEISFSADLNLDGIRLAKRIRQLLIVRFCQTIGCTNVFGVV